MTALSATAASVEVGKRDIGCVPSSVVLRGSLTSTAGSGFRARDLPTGGNCVCVDSMCGVLEWERQMQHLVKPGLLLGRERSFKAIKRRPDRNRYPAQYCGIDFPARQVR
jgi:hypothetical protein